MPPKTKKANSKKKKKVVKPFGVRKEVLEWSRRQRKLRPYKTKPGDAYIIENGKRRKLRLGERLEKIEKELFEINRTFIDLRDTIQRATFHYPSPAQPVGIYPPFDQKPTEIVYKFPDPPKYPQSFYDPYPSSNDWYGKGSGEQVSVCSGAINYTDVTPKRTHYGVSG